MKEVPLLLQSNMRTVKKHQPKLAALLQENIDDATVLKEPVLQETLSGRWVWELTEKPFFEKKTLLEKHSGIPATSVYFVLGIGCPPYLFHVLRSIPRQALAVIIIEPSVNLLLFTISQTSVYQALPEGCRLAFVIRDDREFIDEALEHNVLPLGIFPIEQAHFIVHDAFKEDDTLRGLYSSFKKEVLYRLNMLGNSPEDTLLGIRHGFLNIKSIMQSTCMLDLKELFKNRPCVCVASGPSLEKNVDLLKGLEEKCIIVACDTALLLLLRKGICPHVVTTIERPFLNYETFLPPLLREFPEQCSKILLLSQSVSYPLTAGRWPGPLLVVGKLESPADQWIVGSLLNKTIFLSGMSVAHMAFSFAVAMEASSIAFIGQDLAFSDVGESHFKGALSEEIMDVDKSLERIYLPGALGGEVESHKLWQLFLQIFERYISMLNSTIPVFDCTEGGARINGTKIEPFYYFIEQFVTPLESFDVLSVSAFYANIKIRKPIDSKLLDGILLRLDNELASLEKVDSLLNEMEKMIERVVAPAILPLKRRECASKVAHMIDECHSLNRVVAFIGQSYTHMAGASLAGNRFLETVEEVKAWENTHREMLEGHRINIVFLRHWMFYARIVLQAMSKTSLSEQSTVKEDVERAFLKLSLDTEHPLTDSEIYRLTNILNEWDLGEGSWDPLVRWKAASFLKSQGRVSEARRLMVLAYEQLKEQEKSIAFIESFFKDWINLAIAHDLCEFPQYNLALSLLENLSGLLPEKHNEIEGMRHRVYEMQRNFYNYAGDIAIEAKRRFSIQTYRNKAEEALMSKNLAEAFKWVECLVFEGFEILPEICIPYLRWLLKTSFQCIEAADPLIAEASQRAVENLWNERSRFSSIRIEWPIGIIAFLESKGLKTDVQTAENNAKEVVDEL